MQTSTEQLTRYSTGTLEQVSDNVDGVVATQTVSKKIMSVCKNTIRWVLLLDVLLATSVLVILLVLEFGSIPQQHLGFYCNDPKISFKFMGDTVSLHILIITSLVVPIIVMSVAEFMCHPADSYDVVLGCAGSRVKQISVWYGHYFIGLITLTFICDIMKVLIGEPRPHFLDTCKPREAQNCTSEFVGSYTCTNTVDAEWFVTDSSKSFPSGHSAISMFTTIFLVWYLESRLPSRTFLLKPWLQCMVCLWVVICSLSRIADHRHHWWDVLAGDVLGFAFSVLTVTVPCSKFRFRGSSSHGCAGPLENGEISFNDKRHQSVKKLLSEPSMDVPEDRELKNISTRWKE